MTSDRLQRLRQLSRQKESIEHEIGVLVASLESTPPGLRGPLVDEAGFPRTDCDVFQVRQQRHRLACLQTDHQLTMKEIELLLPEVLVSEATRAQPVQHADETRRSESKSYTSDPRPVPVLGNTKGTMPDGFLTQEEPECRPFARVVQVETGSPAAQGGLRVGDKLIRVGSCVSWEALAATVSSHYGRPLIFTIQREVTAAEHGPSQSMIDAVVIPSPWAGAGLVGARFERHLAR
jgi:26S proteasome non-ATPase regulatory subunit 9